LASDKDFMLGCFEHRLAVAGGDLCWFEWGAPSPDQPTIILVHATGFHARCWDQVVAALPPQSHVIAPDLRGHGRSYRPASLGDWSATADDLLPLIDALPGALVGVGHSMGGVCVLHAAAQRAGRFQRLALIDPVIFAPEFYAASSQILTDPDDHFVSRRRNHWASADAMIAHFADRLPYSNWDPAVLADYCRYGLLPRSDGDGFELACPPRLEASAYIGNAGYNPLAAAAAINCPVTIVRARNAARGETLDFSISPTWPELASAFPDATDLHWTDQSHFIPMEAPRRIASLFGTESPTA
jgi:pimeloyl-ACP methyl ester carboxylesterase